MHRARQLLWSAAGKERAAEGLREAVETIRLEAADELASLLATSGISLAESVSLITKHYQRKEEANAGGVSSCHARL